MGLSEDDMAVPAGLAADPDRARLARWLLGRWDAATDGRLDEAALDLLLDLAWSEGVRVQARHADSLCVIEVIDDGPGVAAAAQARIFKLFQTATAAERGGSGIGLALTRRVVEVHGGRIELASPWPAGGDRGACFRVCWPRFPRRTTDA